MVMATCAHCGAQRERGPGVYRNPMDHFSLCNPECYCMVYRDGEKLGERTPIKWPGKT